MVRKETCPVCKGNKVVRVERENGGTHKQCPGCNGAGYKVSIVHLAR